MSLATTLLNEWHGGWAGGGWWFGPWGWLFGPVLGLFWIAVAAIVVWFVWRTQRGGGGHDGMQRARETLAERYARGELTTEEYRERLDQLG